MALVEATEEAIEAIAAQNVDMVFTSRAGQFQILKDINLSVPQAKVQLLMGPSGSGKTTLLQILSGLLTPTAGHVYLLGEDITQLISAKRAQFRLHHIGFIAQDFNLFPALTAAENIQFALSLKGIRGRAARQQTRSLLAQVELSERADHMPRQLSGGQQQRVAIARALTGNPALIMADEPTAALDSKSGRTVMGLLRRLTQEQNCTVLTVTHDLRMLDFADRVTYLEDGKIVSAS